MKRKRISRMFPFSWRDFLISAAILLSAVELCILLRMVDSSGEFASLIFVLAVMTVSRLTTGYLFGLLAAVVGVVSVNYVFTYPFFALNFTIAGYPITFLTMFAVSVVTCAMTTQIKQQEQLRLENEKEKMRSNLLRSVSHDIRTPLTSIVGATSTMLENETSLTVDARRELLQDVREEAQWLIRVVENLLSVTRIGEDRAKIDKKAEAAEEVLGEAVRKFRKRFPQIAVEVAAPDELLMVPMDAILIEQVLANLLENAVVHGESTSRVRISVSKAENSAIFSVQDNGTGIPKSKLPSLLDGEFNPSNDSVSQGKRNMGLGLTVCKAIVCAHDGTMHACNPPSGGAEFSFCLPL